MHWGDVMPFNFLTEDQFDKLRQIVYEIYNPSYTVRRWPKNYVKIESVYCMKASINFHRAMKSQNRFRIILATARVAKARYEFYKECYSHLRSTERGLT